jgi:D-glycero-alpha-D-manno-heptose-7-phosphate kinase
MKDLHEKLKKEVGPVGLKVCGAGGGGCFILAFEAPKQDDVKEIVKLFGMQVMELKVEKPAF